MIRSSIATRLGTLAAIAACFAGLLAPEASAQGRCSYADIAIQPNGDLSIVCNSVGGVPVCTLSVPDTAIKGQAFSISASCNPAAASFNWSSNSSATLPTGSSGTVAIGATGTYTFAVSGTNSFGTGAVFSKTVSVQEPVARVGPPSCSAFAASPNPVTVGSPTTISLTCTETPDVYAWSMYAGPSGGIVSGFSPSTASGSQTVTFNVAGNYNFAAQAGNPLGASAMAGLSVAVTAAQPPPVIGCIVPNSAVPPTPGYETLGNLRFDLKPGQSGYQQFDFPLAGFSSARVSITGSTRLDTPPNTVSEIAVADCPGKFDVPDACKVTVLGSGGLNFYVGPTSDCPLSAKKYYVNIRDTTCTPSSGFPACAHYIKVSGQ